MSNTIIAETILNQMGGYNRLAVMVGMNNPLASDNSLSFRFKVSKKFNYCKVTLNGKDLYDVSIGQIRKKKGVPTYVEKNVYNDVYCDQLIPIFEETTGLYLHL